MNQPTNLIADTIIRTVELGLTITGASVNEQVTYIDAQPAHNDPYCPNCHQPAPVYDHRYKRVTDVPVAGYPTRLSIRLPRYRCINTHCPRHIFQQHLDCIDAGKSTTTRCVLWILKALAERKMSIRAIAQTLGISWDTVNSIACCTATTLTYHNPSRLDGVRVLGVDEHCWRHRFTCGDSRFVTVIVDLTPVLEHRGRARLLDMVPGRSANALASWLDQQDKNFRDRIEVVSMDGFQGYHTAVKRSLPQATKIMDPFHVVALAGNKLELTRQRVQQSTLGHRGRTGDPLYGIRKVLLTRRCLLTERQKQRLEKVFSDPDHVEVDVTHWCYQDIVAAYGHPNPKIGKKFMHDILRRLRNGLPRGLEELAQLGRTLWRKRREILAYFDVGASNGPVEAINGRLEHLRGIALGFRNLEHYILRSLIHSGKLIPSS